MVSMLRMNMRSLHARMLALPVLASTPALVAAAAAPTGRAGLAFAGGAVAAALSVLCSLRLHRTITRPLHEIADAARRVVSRGDYSVRASKVADDEAGSVADAFNDMLTEIERGVRSLGESQARYRCLVEAMARILWVADSRGMITQPAPAWQAHTGQSDAETAGLGWVGALHPDDAGPVLIAWRAALVTRSVFEHECRVRGSDGAYRRFEARGVPVRDGDGAIREWVCVFTDAGVRGPAAAAPPRRSVHMMAV